MKRLLFTITSALGLSACHYTGTPAHDAEHAGTTAVVVILSLLLISLLVRARRGQRDDDPRK